MSTITQHPPTKETPGGLEPGQEPTPRRRRGKAIAIVGGIAAATALVAVAAVSALRAPAPSDEVVDGRYGNDRVSSPTAQPNTLQTVQPTPEASPSQAPALNATLCAKLGSFLTSLTGNTVTAANCYSNADGAIQAVDGTTASGGPITIAVIDGRIAGPITDHIGESYSGYGTLADFRGLPTVQPNRFQFQGADGQTHYGATMPQKGEAGVGPGENSDLYVLLSVNDGMDPAAMQGALKTAVATINAQA